MIHFSKKSGRLSSTGSKILTFDSHCSANFQPIIDCLSQNFKFNYDNLKNIKTGRVNSVVFNLYQIKQLKFFFGTPGTLLQVNEVHSKPPHVHKHILIGCQFTFEITDGLIGPCSDETTQECILYS